MTAMRALKYIPNYLTLARVALTPVFLLLLLHGAFSQAFAVFAAIGLTDLLDGFAARALGACTRFGAVMDVAADLLFIVSSLFVMNMLNLTPVWLTMLVLCKFTEFCATSYLLGKGRRSGTFFIPDPPGKLCAVLFYLIPGVVCLHQLIPFDQGGIALTVFLTCTALTSLASTCLRCLLCIKRRRFI